MLVLALAMSQLLGCARQSYIPIARGPYFFQDELIAYSIGIGQFDNGLRLSFLSAREHADLVQNGRVVALNIGVHPDESTWAQLHSTYFSLLCENTSQLAPVTDGAFDADLKAAGYTPWADPSAGGDADGWVAFVIPGIRNPKNCSVTYDRPTMTSPEGIGLQRYKISFQLVWIV